jgi:hypothetical protein
MAQAPLFLPSHYNANTAPSRRRIVRIDGQFRQAKRTKQLIAGYLTRLKTQGDEFDCAG